MKPDELKEFRARLGFTQEQLAIELGVHRLSVIRWETGARKIPPMLTLALKQVELEHYQMRDAEVIKQRLCLSLLTHHRRPYLLPR
jgi:DNA-binding XRE family transcriptional regulator